MKYLEFEVSFLRELDRLKLNKKDVANKLQISRPTLNSKIQNPDKLTVRDLRLLGELNLEINIKL